MDIGIFEGGAIAVCLGLVGTMWGFLQKLVSSKLREQYEIIVKLIDRINRSDDAAERRHNAMIEKTDDLEKAVVVLTDKISYLQGRINSKAI
ncbi:MAG: hypothetical protein COB10_10645 [Planctomycetota bacterium]|jgi:hypothetical protein|nr:MAG: hypothetical protein COB10_10645 [Planctomycetota bacterium]